MDITASELIRIFDVFKKDSGWFVYDTEFCESGPNEPIYFLSIGMIGPDQREFYAVNKEFPIEKAHPWLKEHVLSHIDWAIAKSLSEIRVELQQFVESYNIPIKFLADTCAYDHVVLCQIFGTMVQLPVNWPHITWDLAMFEGLLGDPAYPSTLYRGNDHNALDDARRCFEKWQWLQKYARMNSLVIPG